MPGKAAHLAGTGRSGRGTGIAGQCSNTYPSMGTYASYTPSASDK
jgi:hypothetical protein